MVAEKEHRARALGARIRLARRTRGLTSEEVAARADVDVSVLGAWETGRLKPSSDMIVGLASALDVSATALRNGGPAWDAQIVEALRQVREKSAVTGQVSSSKRRLSYLAERDKPKPPCETGGRCPVTTYGWCEICKKVADNWRLRRIELASHANPDDLD